MMEKAPAESKARILSVTGRQVRRSGSRAVTLDTVSRETGCAKGLITYHFGGRDQLLAAAATELLSARESEWKTAISASSLETAISQVFRLLTDEHQSGFWKAWVSLSAEGTKLTVQAVSAHWSALTEIVAASLVQLLAVNGLESTVGEAVLGRLFAAGVQGLGLQLYAGAGVETVDEAHTALWAAVMGLTRRAR
jgi:AcrR family transcriptional regulator